MFGEVNTNIDQANPVNWTCPYLVGLKAWWRCLSGQYNSYYVVNLASKPGSTKLDGYRTTSGGDVQAHAPYWSPTDRPGGEAHLLFQGNTSPTGSFQTADALSGTTPFSVVVWCWVNAYNGDYDELWSQAGGGDNCDLLLDVSSHVFSCYLGGGTQHQDSLAAAPLKTWTHVVCTWSPSNLKMYVNASLQGTTAVASRNTSAAAIFSLGLSNAFGRPFNGALDDVMVFSRELTQSDVTFLYQQAQLGWPTALNRVGPQVYNTGARVVFRRTLSSQGTRVGSRQGAV